MNSTKKSKNYSSKNLYFAYGGIIIISYVFDYCSKVQLIPSVLSGRWRIGEEETVDEYIFFKTTNNLFVLQPELELEINVIKYFKIALGVNYRLFTGVDLRNYTNDDFLNLGGAFAFKFGKF